MVDINYGNTGNTVSVLTLLDAVTEATEVVVKTAKYKDFTISVLVASNTGAVTVNIEQSPNGSDWFSLDSKTYTAVEGSDTFSYSNRFAYIRTTTTTQSNSTVTTFFNGGN